MKQQGRAAIFIIVLFYTVLAETGTPVERYRRIILPGDLKRELVAVMHDRCLFGKLKQKRSHSLFSCLSCYSKGVQAKSFTIATFQQHHVSNEAAVHLRLYHNTIALVYQVEELPTGNPITYEELFLKLDEKLHVRRSRRADDYHFEISGCWSDSFSTWNSSER